MASEQELDQQSNPSPAPTTQGHESTTTADSVLQSESAAISNRSDGAQYCVTDEVVRGLDGHCALPTALPFVPRSGPSVRSCGPAQRVPRKSSGVDYDPWVAGSAAHASQASRSCLNSVALVSGGMPRAAETGSLHGAEEEPPVCPDEDTAVVQRLGALQQAVPRMRFRRDAHEAEDRDAGWCGPVAAEQPDGPHQPLTGPWALLGPSHMDDGKCRLEGARQQLHAALQALQACDMQVRSHIEEQRSRNSDVAKREASAIAAELAEAQAEAAVLRRELQRLRGVPHELAALPTNGLHALQQELSASLQGVHNELEGRMKCCICREVERQVLLRPCQHLALCNECARRVDKCPLCRRNIERYEAVCVA